MKVLHVLYAIGGAIGGAALAVGGKVGPKDGVPALAATAGRQVAVKNDAAVAAATDPAAVAVVAIRDGSAPDAADDPAGVPSSSGRRAQADDIQVRVFGVDMAIPNVQEPLIGGVDNQDSPDNIMSVSVPVLGGLSTVTATGNSWKYVTLPEPIIVSTSTVLKFTFGLPQESEKHGICLLDSEYIRNGRPDCFYTAGSQGVSNQRFVSVEPLTEEGQTLTYEIPVGSHFKGNVTSLGFILDNDGADDTTGESSWSNIEIYDPTTASPTTASPTTPSPTTPSPTTPSPTTPSPTTPSPTTPSPTTPSPTTPSPTTPSPISSGPWDISYQSIANNFSNSSGKEISTDFFIGKNRKSEISLLRKDCQSNITDISINTTKAITSENATHNLLSVIHSVDKSSIANSSIWNGTSSEIEVCQVVRLIVPAGASRDNGKMVIAKDIRQITIGFNLQALFNLTTVLASATIFNQTSTTDVSSYVKAYKCAPSNNFAPDDSALGPNQELFVCVVSKGLEVNVDKLVKMTASQPENPNANLDIIEDGGASIPSITSLDYVDAINGAMVGTRLPSNTFNFASGASITIQGEVQMKLAGGGTRKLRALADAGIESDEKASYSLNVDLQEGNAVAADGVLAVENSATAFVVLDKAFIIAAAIAFAFAA